LSKKPNTHKDLIKFVKDAQNIKQINKRGHKIRLKHPFAMTCQKKSFYKERNVLFFLKKKKIMAIFFSWDRAFLEVK
jgi:hypothetical protein